MMIVKQIYKCILRFSASLFSALDRIFSGNSSVILFQFTELQKLCNTVQLHEDQ